MMMIVDEPVTEPYNFGFWCTVIVLVVCLGNLYMLPSWWQGSWRASNGRWWDRAWLTTVLAVTTACLGTIFGAVLQDYDVESRWMWGLNLLIFLVAALLACLIPLVGGWSRFDFAVPPRLRPSPTAPERWASPETLAHGNRAERRRKGRMRSRRR
jgi:hypothetical protein